MATIEEIARAYWKPITDNAIFITNDNTNKRREYEEEIVKTALRDLERVEVLTAGGVAYEILIPTTVAGLSSWPVSEAMPALSGWAGRAQRAHLNMLESLVVFAIAVLVAELAGRTNETTALGATLFFWARVVHPFAQVWKIWGVRTIVFTIGWLG